MLASRVCFLVMLTRLTQCPAEAGVDKKIHDRRSYDKKASGGYHSMLFGKLILSTKPKSGTSEVATWIGEAGPAGLSPAALEKRFPGTSRSTLNRRLAGLVKDGAVKAVGAGRNTRYVSSSPFTRADVDAYFSMPWQQRPAAHFKEDLLAAGPNIDLDKAARCTQIQAIGNPIDKRFLAMFLVDFSWGSSVLEGGTYSALDTQALIQYGQKNNAKPTADAVLVLNHKRGAEYFW